MGHFECRYDGMIVSLVNSILANVCGLVKLIFYLSVNDSVYICQVLLFFVLCINVLKVLESYFCIYF